MFFIINLWLSRLSENGPTSHGFPAQSLMLISQAEPVHPGEQAHSFVNSLSTQTPCIHGLFAQRSIFSWHLFPVKPGGQVHLKSATRSVQLAPSRQGFSAQSSVLMSQSCPSHPGKHWQENRPCCSATHDAPFWHGFPWAVQGLICKKDQDLEELFYL